MAVAVDANDLGLITTVCPAGPGQQPLSVKRRGPLLLLLLRDVPSPTRGEARPSRLHTDLDRRKGRGKHFSAYLIMQKFGPSSSSSSSSSSP